MKNDGSLYVISTPIGNRDDITLRALQVLKKCDIIASEDTRHSGSLMSHYGIKGTFLSYNDRNKNRRIPLILNMLKEGKNIGLVSDAGTPLISDPGYQIVQAVIRENIEIIPIPGPSAILTALSVSGMPTDAFAFYGFIPKKGKRRKLILNSIGNTWTTSILFESPLRIKETLNAIYEYCGNRKVVLARELTKIYEEFIRGDIEILLQKIDNNEIKLKGEIVLLIEGNKNV